MAQENISLDILNQRYPNLKSGSNSLVYVARDRQLLGVILYSDPPRPESQQIIEELQSQGITPYMLSGDVNRVAKAVAEELGIEPDCVYAEAFPEGKVEVVKALHDSGKTVAFCGDGINDSAALAYADVSISFGGATDIARETADVVLMENDLRGLLLAIQVAKHAMKIVWENTALVVIPNIGAVIAGVFLAIDPVLAIIINNGSAILAELNGLRPLLGPDESKLLVPSVDRANLQEKIDRPQKLERTKTTVANIKPVRDLFEEQRQSAPQSSAGISSGGCFEQAQYVSLKVSA
jgi:Cu2+-exporting ATPase